MCDAALQVIIDGSKVWVQVTAYRRDKRRAAAVALQQDQQEGAVNRRALAEKEVGMIKRP